MIDRKFRTPHERAVWYNQFDYCRRMHKHRNSHLSFLHLGRATTLCTTSRRRPFGRQSIDQRGFQHLIQAEAAESLEPSQTLFNATVAIIASSDSGLNLTHRPKESQHTIYIPKRMLSRV